jgi:hypothetical protein
VGDGDAGGVEAGEELGADVGGVGENVGGVQQGVAIEAFEEGEAEAAAAVVFVAGVFGDVDVDAGGKLGGKLGESIERVVVEREEGVGADEGGEGSVAEGGALGEIAAVFFEAGGAAGGPWRSVVS